MHMTSGCITQAKEIAIQVVNGALNPNEGCAAIAAICETNGWPATLLDFSALNHEQTDHEEFGLDAENSTFLIIEQCHILLNRSD
jgi:hypothetical protein